MIGYTTIGTSDMERAKKFYADLFEAQGAKVLVDIGRLAMIGKSMGEPMVAVCTPYNEDAPDPGNGNMIAYSCASKAEVDSMYAKAISLGAHCEGEPGQRMPDMFYGAYVRDLDGNKLAFFIFA